MAPLWPPGLPLVRECPAEGPAARPVVQQLAERTKDTGRDIRPTPEVPARPGRHAGASHARAPGAALRHVAAGAFALGLFLLPYDALGTSADSARHSMTGPVPTWSSFTPPAISRCSGRKRSIDR
ncbi:hypothetical protein ACFVH0_16950, partial [Streptomyces sp. NPDC127117]